MDPIPRILAFAGSARADSYNNRLVKVAAQGAQAAGADATIVDLRDYRLPLFDQDLEEGAGTDETPGGLPWESPESGQQ
jgi:NAD(P)H-dependent FMN reductase